MSDDDFFEAPPASLLGPDGLLARSIPGFAPRRPQQRMADAVAQALAEQQTLIVEAGTGTGKTYAYLVPALLSGLRTVVSTGTLTLQDQLFRRDLPRVRDALGVSVRTALLKGRANYLCLYRMKRARALPALRGLYDQLHRVEQWARSTDSGELSELGDFRDDAVLARQITSTADNCLGSRCSDFEKCFVVRARRQAQAADLVVVNHHLLFADFTIREQGFGQILSGADAVVVDEAHQLPELAAQFFGSRVSTRQLQELARDVQVEAQNCGDLPALVECAQRLSGDVVALEHGFASAPGRLPLQRFRAEPGSRFAIERVDQSLEEMFQGLRPVEERNAELSAALERVMSVRERWRRIIDEVDDAAGDASDEVRWSESMLRGGSLNATPIDLSDGFRRMRAMYPGAWIFTSATLAAAGDFGHYQRELGLQDAQVECLESPFDYADQARLYLPTGLPDPNAAGYAEAVADAAQRVIEASGGGVFVLCTSHRALRVIGERLRRAIGLTVLCQGEESRSALIDRFVADGNAVLVGTSSFWEGVDVRGQALRVVIIDRLPFAAPGDPVQEAKQQAIRVRGGSPFAELQLPEAIVTLRQGVGRLIRDRSDRGLLMLCDPRVTSKSYGRRVLAALPSMPVIRRFEDAEGWLRSLADAEDVAVGETR